ncbi:MAG: glycosyltransferase, partial [Longimicrobiales bacterium]
MTTAVIISTYNQPDWLEKVLWGYAAQSTADFDLIIADDGSGQDTLDVIERAHSMFEGRLQHIWHEDRGFRKCEILNRAIVAARADYLIFTDGDCIPRRDFVRAHMELGAPDRFLSGGVIWLPRSLSHGIVRKDVESGRIADARWLLGRGWPGGRHRLRLSSHRALSWTLDVLTPTRATFNG